MALVLNTVKFLIGFVLAIALLAAGGFAASRYLITKMTAPPPKPIFANDKPVGIAKKPTTPAKAATPSPKPTASPKPTLPPGAYEARVSWPDGLILRDGPGADAISIGGVDNNTKVIVLEESPDKAWQKVRVGESTQEGWIKAGNITREN